MTSLLRKLNAASDTFEADLAALTARHDERDGELVNRVATIIASVRKGGDAALLKLTQELDQHPAVSIKDLIVEPPQMLAALNALEPDTRAALETAANRIRDYHQYQVAQSWSFEDELGNRLGQQVTPMTRVGIYVPGGKASYPSSVLMNAIPAKVAGVPEVVMVVPAPGGEINPLVLAAAALAGVDRIVTAGGAQAVAALAFGTETLAGVDKIVGPGNRYVAEAKRQVFGVVGIDMVAGPSEVLIIADGSAPASWMAMDLFSQAEHDEQAQAILISPDDAYLDAVEVAMETLLSTMSREGIIRAALANRGALIKVHDLDDAISLSNRLAPEHLQLAFNDAETRVSELTVAGAIFVGAMSCESLGDYCAGPNHVLPTSSTARFSSPLGVYDFQKRSSIIHCSTEGAMVLGRVASVLARGESLEAHARSAELRLATLDG
ncbi:MAG: histidinol dehydrogenase [Halieaceae bacterium]|nr:histidinol dehydrogenase [Halieaceae bacterium]MDG1828515.1 histidinol dehydrogenase [Luminiphilus sp.]MBT4854382.1 histidinol dehydrogenase [Halieaceae bacterium]MBT5209801.1 histidinol dehydrogenase [Halieaceae bacterium]MBT6265861.1 histidinol dehydrogenase [Halieaceae bacterium]